MNTNQRYHSLDSLRAIMMMLGIVLHACVSYVHFPTAQAGYFYNDPQSSQLLGITVLVIHYFRMPVFFTLTGFFGALLFYRRSPEAYYQNRIQRILYPFIVFWVLLTGFKWLSILLSTHYLEYGRFGIDFSTLNNYEVEFVLEFQTMHLWFLYYLLFYIFISWGIHKTLGVDSSLNKRLIRLGNYLFSKIFRIFWIVIPLCFFAYMDGAGNGIANNSFSFIPDPLSLAYYGIFFAAGWYMYDHRDTLIPAYKKSAWWFMAAAAVGVFIILILLGFKRSDSTDIQLISKLLMPPVANITTVCFVMAFIGVFERLFAQYSSVMRYITDSSYWVYLFHMQLVVIFAVMLRDVDINAMAKVSIVMAEVTAACFISYQLFVRKTFIGEFLSGKKF